jgi:ABC-type branched-subunit amino acid transport system ATPase component
VIGALLTIEDVVAGYGGVAVLHGVDLVVNAGEVVTMVGPNGAGKTTVLRCVSGLVCLSGGRILFAGDDLAAVDPATRARLGIAHVPENRGLFPGLTVGEHFRLGHRREHLDAGIAFEYFPALAGVRDRRAGVRSGGEQQMLAVGRALARSPRVLLLDELTLGLAPVLVEHVLPAIRRFAIDTECGVLLVEQQVTLAFAIADRGYVLARGRVAMHGTAAELRGSRAAVEATYVPVRPQE